MIRRRVLSLPVVLATLAAAIAGLLTTYVYFSWTGVQRDLSDTRKENSYLAVVIAEQMSAEDFQLGQLATFVPLMIGEEQFATVERNGQIWSGGATIDPVESTATTSRTVPNGKITIVGTVDPAFESPVNNVVVVSLVVTMVVGVAAATTALVNRRIRRRVDVAVAAAERMAAGDLRARVGEEGASELARFGKAFDLMASRLEAVDSDQRQLLADLAHEIATPVNALAGFSIAVLDGTIPRERAEPAIMSNSARLSSLLSDLAQLRSLDSAAVHSPARLDLNQLATELAHRFETLAEAKGLTLQMMFEANPLVVVADCALVDSVLTNLIGNAIRYTPSGGRVDIVLRLDAGRPIAEIRDNGPGIAKEHVERIFDRFYRVDAARDRDSGGSGLGLAIAKRAAEACGARIQVESAPGAGSTFRVVFAAAAVVKTGPPPAR